MKFGRLLQLHSRMGPLFRNWGAYCKVGGNSKQSRGPVKNPAPTHLDSPFYCHC